MSLSPEALEQAVKAIQVNGYIVFESILSDDFVQTLYDTYMQHFNAYLQNPDPTFGENHYRMFLPFDAPFNDPQIIENPRVIPILEDLLGEDFVCHYFASNTCLPGSSYQPAHSDVYNLFPESDIRTPPYHMVLNIPLVDMTFDNGPMEFWAGGTHYNTLSMDEIGNYIDSIPSQMATMPKGSIMLRDGRMWHRGTPNKSDQPRPNIALVFTRAWLADPFRIGIPTNIYEGLSERAQKIFRQERIGAPLDGPGMEGKSIG